MDQVSDRQAIETASGLSSTVTRGVGIGLLIGAVVIVMVFVVGRSYFEGKKFEKLRDNKYAIMPPARGLEEQRARTVLESYAWVDKEKGVVQIPIERAMEVTALEAGSR